MMHLDLAARPELSVGLASSCFGEAEMLRHDILHSEEIWHINQGVAYVRLCVVLCVEGSPLRTDRSLKVLPIVTLWIEISGL